MNIAVTDMYDLAGEPRPKFCINCKHIGRNGSGDAKRYRCLAPQNVRRETIDLVTGEKTILFNAETCYDARQAGWCSAEGSWFERAPPRIEVQAAKMPSAATDLLSQLDKMK